jgi:hypothetical protein
MIILPSSKTLLISNNGSTYSQELQKGVKNSKGNMRGWLNDNISIRYTYQANKR